MNLLDYTLPTVAANLALDEALLLAAEEQEHGEILRFWEWSTPAIVLGSGGIYNNDIHEENVQRDSVPVYRRSSGGGTVILNRGCLLFTLILNYDTAIELEQIHSSYEYISQTMCAALSQLGLKADSAGISDLVHQGLKFSGNAQQRKRYHLLHHGTILYDMDLSLIGKYLLEPPRQPEYRQHRTHQCFVGNLPSSSEQLKDTCQHIWNVQNTLTILPDSIQERVNDLVESKYTLDSWTHRR